MALKSVVEIDVQDDKFREFQAQYARYEEALKKVPGAWDQIAGGTDKAAAAFGKLVEKHQSQGAVARLNALAAAKAAELMRKADYDALSRLDKIRKGTESWGAAVGKVADRWKAVAVYSAKTSINLESAAVSLLKWTSALGVASALLGAGGGLFGIERLATSASDKRRQSMTTGVPIGRQTAFDLDYKRFGDTQAITSNIATAQTDVTSDQYKGLLGAGIRATEIQQKNAADLGVELFEKLPRLFPNGAKDPTLGPRATGLGLTSVISIEDIKKYLNASPEERDAQRKAYGKDAGDLRIDDPVARAWQDLTTQISRAGEKIEATFITGLVPLAGPIGDVSKAFGDLAAAFLKSDAVKSNIEALAGGLETAAKYVGSDDFKSDIKGFVVDVGKLAKAVADAYHWFTGLLGGNKSTPEEDAQQGKLAAFDPTTDGATHGEGLWHRAFNNGLHGHPTVRSAINDEDYNDRVKEKQRAFGGHPKASEGGGTSTGMSPNTPEGAARGRMRHDGASLADRARGHLGPGYTGRGDLGRVSKSTLANGDESFAFWRAKGLSPDAAAGLVGMEQGEALYNPGDKTGDGGQAHGSFQWHKPRRDAIRAATGIDIDHATHLQQLEAAYWEMTQSKDAGARRAWDLVNRPGVTAGQAAAAGTTYFERPEDKPGQSMVRGKFAQGWLDRESKTAPAPAATTPTPAPPAASGSMGAPVAPSAPAIGDQAALDARRRLTAGRGTDADRDTERRYREQQNAPTTGRPAPVLATGTAADPGAEARQHIANLKLLLATKQHRAFPWQHRDFRAAVQAAQSAAGIERAREEGRRQAEQPRRHMGLSDDRYQRKPVPNVLVQNNTGANVNVTAAMAGATVGYG